MTEHTLSLYSRLISEQFPAYTPWAIECLSVELSELDVTAHELRACVEDFEEQGYFPEDALDKALDDNLIHVQPPKDHMFIRVTKEGELPVLLLLKLPAKEDLCQPT